MSMNLGRASCLLQTAVTVLAARQKSLQQIFGALSIQQINVGARVPAHVLWGS